MSWTTTHEEKEVTTTKRDIVITWHYTCDACGNQWSHGLPLDGVPISVHTRLPDIKGYQLCSIPCLVTFAQNLNAERREEMIDDA